LLHKNDLEHLWFDEIAGEMFDIAELMLAVENV